MKKTKYLWGEVWSNGEKIYRSVERDKYDLLIEEGGKKSRVSIDTFGRRVRSGGFKLITEEVS